MTAPRWSKTLKGQIKLPMVFFLGASRLKRPATNWRIGLLQPVDSDVPAVDPVRAGRGGEDNDIGYFLSGAQPAHRKAVANVIIEIVRTGRAVTVPAVALNQNGAG